MIYELMKRDRSWKAVPILTLACAVICPLWVRSAASSFSLPSISAIFVLITVACCHAHIRTTPFQVSLPIAGRQLFLARALTMLAVLWAPAIVTAIVLTFQGLNGSVAALQLLELSALATLIVFAVQSVRVQEFESPLSLRWMLIFLVLILWACEGINLPAAPVLMVCLLTSVLLFIKIWRSIPQSFQMAPPEASLKTMPVRPSASSANKDAGIVPAMVWQTYFRSLFSWRYLIVLPLLFFLMTPPSFAAILFVLLLWSIVRRQVRWLWTLPIRLSAVLPFVVMPILLSLAGGYSRGIHLSWVSQESLFILPAQNLPPTDVIEPNCKMWDVLPPLEFWKPAHGNKAPLIQAPWGETFQPPTSIVLGYRIYNPYAVGCENSQRFFDWQFARATLAAYGRPISQSEYQGPGHWIPPQMIPQVRTQVLHLAAIAGLALLMILLAELNDWHRFRRLSRRVRVIVWLFLISGLAAFVVPAFLQRMLPFDETYADSLLLRISWALPDNLFIVIAGAVVPLAGLYYFVDKLFREAEFVDKPRQTAA